MNKTCVDGRQGNSRPQAGINWGFPYLLYVQDSQHSASIRQLLGANQLNLLKDGTQHRMESNENESQDNLNWMSLLQSVGLLMLRPLVWNLLQGFCHFLCWSTCESVRSGIEMRQVPLATLSIWLVTTLNEFFESTTSSDTFSSGRGW